MDGRPIVWEGKLLDASDPGAGAVAAGGPVNGTPAAGGPATGSPAGDGFAFEKRNTVNLPPQREDAFLVRPPAPLSGPFTLRTIEYPAPGVINAAGETSLPVREGALSIEGHPGLAWIKVLNRYGRNTAGTGLLRGYPLTEGAIASTISHDSHNVTVVYREAALACRAVNALIECGGGIAYVDGAGLLSLLPLPVGGLMSTDEPERVAEQVEKVEAAYRAANGAEARLMNIAIMALPVIPALRVSDLGIVDVLAQKVIPLFPETET
jgi:adenine deaminase